MSAILGVLACVLFMASSEAQQPVTPDFGKQIQEWQRTVDSIENRTAVGPVDPASIGIMRERLKTIRTTMEEGSKSAEEALRAQKDLLATLGPAPVEGSAIKEAEEVTKRREELTAKISELDAQIKQAALLSARAANILEGFGKQKTNIRKTVLLQKSGMLLAPDAVQTAATELRDFATAYRLTPQAVVYWFVAALVLLAFYRSRSGMKGWLAGRKIIDASPRAAGLFIHMLLPALILLADRLDVMGANASAPVASDFVRLGVGVWLASMLFLFLYSVRIRTPEEDDDTGLPLGFLGFVLGVLRLAALAIIPAALYGYVQLGAYISLNIFASLFAVALFIAARIGIIGANEKVGKWLGREKLLSPFMIALMEPLLALGGFLFAAAFWGLTPGDVRDWAERYRTGIIIGNIHLDFSDAGAAVVVFFILYITTKAIQLFLSRRLFPQTHMDRGVQDAVYTLIGYTGVTIALLTGLGTLGLDMEKLAIVAGALSVGIGFGLQAVVNNFVSGLILLFERPIRVGDFINVGTETGLVKKIRVRSTELETLQFASIVVPNSKLITETVTNWTLSGRTMRIEIKVGVAYGSDTGLVKRLLTEIALEHPQVRKRPEPSVLFVEFAASSLDFELRCFIRDINERFQIASDLRFAIDRAFRENGVEIPFPQRSVTVKPANATLKDIVS